MRESKIEKYLRRQVKKAGGQCFKWVSPGQKDVPDDIVLFPGACLCFVETKPTKGKPRPGQARMHARLWKMGFPVAIIDSKELADSFVLAFSKQSAASRLHLCGHHCGLIGGFCSDCQKQVIDYPG